ncbi:Gfo/Idh/MocA family protein [Sandaracinobacteroides saxicola]|uniref:Gfo/Idh/MocA family oxidoreductase n=1 Tax=Sandaracinobacteroides saxicola TaxID=2759707 RepID=A0A7G5ILD0_9SPHN|nr:Gfo/Idh/MocA family oxidoreductase [Sandaracinobacteroides saxicola]QMW24172.1 Gfo/Idh/MocA family oxidoreductase [Sandaracinobacteroides saxicola]
MGEAIAPLNWGLIGTGMMGVEHIQNLAITPGARIVAIADPVENSRAQAKAAIATAFGDTPLALHDNPADLLAAGGIDAVLVASPNHTHRAILEAVFAHDVHILCEKPLATNVADARWIATQAKSRKKLFWTAMEYRFMPPVAEFIREVHEGRVGRLRMLSIREHRFPFLVKVNDWNRFSANTGGTMVEKCCHFFDLMRHIVKSEPTRVYCSGAMDVNHVGERYEAGIPDIIDNSYTIVDFANGVRAMLDLCMFADGAEEQEELTAVGGKARLDVGIPSGRLTYSPRTGFMNPKAVERSIVPVPEAALKAGSHHGSTWFQHQAFAHAAATGHPALVGAEDGLRAVAMGQAAEISAREGRAVNISELL